LPARRRREWQRLLSTSRPVRLLLIGGTVLIATILIIAALVILQFRVTEIHQAKSELMTLNVSLAEQTARAFQSVDLILNSVVDDLHAEGIEDPEEYARLKSGRDTYERLLARTAGVPQLDAVTMIAADGHLINFSRYFPIPPVNVSDRDYFAALRNTVTDRPYVSQPVENRGSGTWTVYIARRVTGRSGNFVGLVLGAVNLQYFEDLYRTLQIGEGGGISLWRRDGILLARYPAIPGIGKGFAIKSFTEVLTHNEAGVYQTSRSIDGYERIVATRAVHDYPIVVNVTRTLPVVLADWRREAMLIGGSGMACVLLIGLLLWALIRQFAAYEAVAAATAEREEAIRAREQAESQLLQSQKLEAIGQLTGGVAHDFNNLLTSVLGNLDLAENRVGDEAVRLLLRNAVRSAERGAELTAQLLAFARKQDLRPRPVDLNELVTGAEHILNRTLDPAVRIVRSLDPDLWPAVADPTQLELVVLNLAINARDAMRDGGGILSIGTRNVPADAPGARPDDLAAGVDFVALAVGDTGTGMTEEVRAKCLEPFFTTKPVGSGSGLGLSMVYGVAKQLGGTIQIDSTWQRGTVVTVYLPRAEHDAPAVRQADPAPLDAAAHVGSLRNSGRILLVDDEADVREVAGTMLREHGYEVIEAEDGGAALAVLDRDVPVDLLVTDFAMPGLRGSALAVEAERRRPGLPILIITGYGGDLAMPDSGFGPRCPILRKPFKPADLVVKVRQCLDAAEPLQRDRRAAAAPAPRPGGG
jgi:signal transduction histidine kinase/CheY-like chemotaxis protein